MVLCGTAVIVVLYMVIKLYVAENSKKEGAETYFQKYTVTYKNSFKNIQAFSGPFPPIMIHFL